MDRHKTSAMKPGRASDFSVGPLFFRGAIEKKSPFLFATFSFGDAKEKVGEHGPIMSADSRDKKSSLF